MILSLLFSGTVFFAFTQFEIPVYAELENGTRVVIQKIPEAKFSSAHIFVRGGSVFEDKQNHGIHHLVEHLVFRCLDNSEQGSIDKRVEQNGCIATGTTNREFIHYKLEGENESVQKSLPEFLRLLDHLKVDANILKNEIDIIEQETAYLQANINRRTDDSAWSIFFRENSWGLNTYGDVAQMRKWPIEEIQGIHKKHYSGSNIVFSISGNFNPDEILTVVKTRLERIPKGEVVPFPEFPILKEDIQHASIKTPSTSFILGLIAPGINNEKEYLAYRVVFQYLSGTYGFASRNNVDLRTSFGPSRSGSLAVFSTYSLPLATDANPLIDLFNHLMSVGVPQDSQANIKNALKNQLMIQSKSPPSTAFLNGLYLLFGKRYDFENQLRMLESLTNEDITKALEHFNPAKSGISIRGIR